MAWSVARWSAIPGLEHAFGGRDDAAPEGVTTLRQVHGSDVFDVAHVRPESNGDGLVATRGGERVGVWTADCVPVHLVAPRPRVAAALHCGWRGSARGIVPSALELLERRYGVSRGDVEAALGPAVGGCCYEVGEEVRTAFESRVGSGLATSGFEERGGRLYLDLRRFLAAELLAAGVTVVERVGPCTACHTDVLHSYRRQRGSGRQLSWIGWLG